MFFFFLRLRRCRNKQPWKSVPQMTGFWRKLLDEPGRPATFPPGSAVSRERNILSKQAHQYARLLRLTSGAGCSLIRHAAERDPPAQQPALAHLSALFSACTACTRPSSILPPVVARHLASPTSGREGLQDRHHELASQWLAGYQHGKCWCSPKSIILLVWSSHTSTCNLDFGFGTPIYLQGLVALHLSSCLDPELRSQTQVSQSLPHHLWLVHLALAFFVHAQSLDAPVYSQRKRIS